MLNRLSAGKYYTMYMDPNQLPLSLGQGLNRYHFVIFLYQPSQLLAACKAVRCVAGNRYLA
jgi:hypothetical protein